MKKRFLSLALFLSLAVSLTVPAFGAEDAGRPVTPTAPEWINEEDYVIFPDDEVFLPENWVDIEELREQVRNGATEMKLPPPPCPEKYYQNGSPAWKYEIALCRLKCAENLGITTDSAKEFFYQAASNFHLASYSVAKFAEDPKSETVVDTQRKLNLQEYRALLLVDYDFKSKKPYWDLWEGWGTELDNHLSYWGITLEEFFDAPYMEYVPAEVKHRVTEDLIQHCSWTGKPVPVSPTGDIQIFIDDKYIRSDVPAVITNNRTTVPIRAVAEALGADVGWEEKTRQVTLTRAGTAIVMTIDSKTALVNGKPVEMDVMPYISPAGRTMIPVRYVAEFFGQKVDWDGDNRRVFIAEDKSVAGNSNLEAWALPMGAMSAALNTGLPNIFGFYPRQAKLSEVCRKTLSSGWNIDNRQDLASTVLSMSFYGHNSTFQEMAADVKTRSEAERKAVSEASSAWPYYMWEYTEKLDKKWGDKGIMAWDLFRMSALVQWGYTAGYVTYEEALILLEPAATRLYENFSSWDEAYENYVDGYNWWARNDVLNQDVWETPRGQKYQVLKDSSLSDVYYIFDDALFETGVIGLPEE